MAGDLEAVRQVTALIEIGRHKPEEPLRRLP